MEKEQTKELLHTCKRAAFSVNGDEGYPYTIPVDYCYDEPEEKIYIHSAIAGHKIDAIRKDAKVCLAVWNQGVQDEGDWAYRVQSCVVFGKARLVKDEDEKLYMIRKLGNKYYPTPEEVEIEIEKDGHRLQMIEVSIEHMSGKRVHEK